MAPGHDTFTVRRSARLPRAIAMLVSICAYPHACVHTLPAALHYATTTCCSSTRASYCKAPACAMLCCCNLRGQECDTMAWTHHAIRMCGYLVSCMQVVL
jgi:hypothetical protein